MHWESWVFASANLGQRRVARQGCPGSALRQACGTTARRRRVGARRRAGPRVGRLGGKFVKWGGGRPRLAPPAACAPTRRRRALVGPTGRSGHRSLGAVGHRVLRELLRIGEVAGQRVRVREDDLPQILVLPPKLPGCARADDPVPYWRDATTGTADRSKGLAVCCAWLGQPESFIVQPSLFIGDEEPWLVDENALDRPATAVDRRATAVDRAAAAIHRRPTAVAG